MAKNKTPKQKIPKPAKGMSDQQAENKLFTDYGTQAGKALGNEYFGADKVQHLTDQSQGPLGSNDTLARTRALATAFGSGTPDATQTDVLARMKSGLEGYTSPEYQAQREQMQRGLNSNLATGMSQLAKAQSRGKVYGAAGAAQQANLQTNAQTSKDSLEQDLMVKNIDEQHKRLGEYGKYEQDLQTGNLKNAEEANVSAGNLEANLRGEEGKRQDYNIKQDEAANAARFNTLTGAGGMANQIEQNKASNKVSMAGVNAINGGGSKSSKNKKAAKFGYQAPSAAKTSAA